MKCQACGTQTIQAMSLGYMPPVNDYVPIESTPREQTWMPTDLYCCPHCELVQLGYVPPPNVVFPASYPYRSGTTRVLRDNFADLAQECYTLGIMGAERRLVIDIGSNDGTLLKNFRQDGHKVLGIEPTDVGRIASIEGIDTIQAFFTKGIAEHLSIHDADLVTCTNCFAHVPNVNEFVEGVLDILAPGGVFVTESHYLYSLLATLQYDTIYHEHLRYYSLRSLKAILERHGLEVFHVKSIPTHGGSIRVYAQRKGGKFGVLQSVDDLLSHEPRGLDLWSSLSRFYSRVVASRTSLMQHLYEIKSHGWTIAGVGAPSRASTVISYCGIDETILEYVCEVQGSLKLGSYMPGTKIPVVDESRLFDGGRQPDYALLFSWHIADDIIPKLQEKGYRGRFLMPCPKVPHVEAAVA